MTGANRKDGDNSGTDAGCNPRPRGVSGNAPPPGSRLILKSLKRGGKVVTQNPTANPIEQAAMARQRTSGRTTVMANEPTRIDRLAQKGTASGAT